MTKDPIDNVEWLLASDLKANDYNPNVVFTPELRLLELSILLTGWVQPILVDEEHTIVDGFHRRMLSVESTKLRERYQGRCPCVVMPIDRPHAIVLTVRMNRAKGSHVAVRMASLVKELVSVHEWPPDQVARELGATKGEVDLLLAEDVFERKDIKNYRYSKAWYPVEEA